ncbi:unnamed protein product, partial [marine sediment metagenome]
TENATGLVKESSVNTLQGVETTYNTYNTFRVLVRSETKDENGRVIFYTDASTYLDNEGKVKDELRKLGRSAAQLYNPNTGLRIVIVTESASGLILNSKITTSFGTIEFTSNTYNSLRVMTGSVTRENDENGRPILITDATGYLNVKNQVMDALRNLDIPLARADVVNPNTGLKSTITVESARGLVITSEVTTTAGKEITENTYNSLRVLTGAITRDQFGNTVLITIPKDIDVQKVRSVAVQTNPNIGLSITITTDTATGLVLISAIQTLRGEEVTENTYIP